MALDYTELFKRVREAGFDPMDRNTLEYSSSSICMDGSRTVTVYANGEHIAVAFVENVEEGGQA